ncbi:hypothetical protein HW555_013880 [Spodoptera exigua]|uniref:Citrate transporter-like domain-containing protein n=1 Tax=Spodoptera exigua TaxID=7107 RepID=A0A835G3B2_SPOEX|nr:hypothetical protein HW555_013880 [Spodoptera exigua]
MLLMRPRLNLSPARVPRPLLGLPVGVYLRAAGALNLYPKLKDFDQQQTNVTLVSLVRPSIPGLDGFTGRVAAADAGRPCGSGALSKLGLIGYIGGWTEALILRVDESDRLAVALILMVWVSGITSAFVDNVPLTTMMVRVVTSLGTHPTLNLPIEPLIWALSFGVCLGGNGTLIGASSNVVCVGLAEQHGYKITFMQFFKIGFPVMIGHLVVATAYLLVCHCDFSWH